MERIEVSPLFAPCYLHVDVQNQLFSPFYNTEKNVKMKI